MTYYIKGKEIKRLTKRNLDLEDEEIYFPWFDDHQTIFITREEYLKKMKELSATVNREIKDIE